MNGFNKRPKSMQIVKIGVLGYATMSCALAMCILHVYMIIHIGKWFLGACGNETIARV